MATETQEGAKLEQLAHETPDEQEIAAGREREQLEGWIPELATEGEIRDALEKAFDTTGGGKVSVSYTDVAALAFTGRDTAAGKSFEAWVKKYWEKKAAGERNIQIEPERLE